MLSLLGHRARSLLAGTALLALFVGLLMPTSAASAATAAAVSQARDRDSGFPLWYQDATGVRLEPCLDPADATCVLPPAGEEPGFDPAQPVSFPGNFPSEFFYSVVDSQVLDTPGCDGILPGKLKLRLAVEGAFANGDPAPGDQMVFGRIRIVASGLCANTEYTFTHPYGTATLTTDEAGAIKPAAGTEDIGCVPTPGVACDFAEALGSRIFGSFLHATAGAPAGYLGDGATLSTVTGSPTGDNLFRVTRDGTTLLETDQFTVSGKIAGPLLASPSAAEYGGVVAGDTKRLPVVLTNVGADPLTPSALTIGGADAADFSVDPGTCTTAALARDDTCTATVAFAPTTAGGRRSATLSVTHGGIRSPLAVPLTGTALNATDAAAIQAAPDSVDFGNQRVRVFSAAKTVAVTNAATATAPLGITGVSVQGMASNEFGIAYDSCTDRFLDPGRSCEIRVTFTPAVIDQRAAALEIRSNDPDGAMHVALTGNGIGGIAAVSSGKSFNFASWYRDEYGVRLAPCFDGTDPNCVLPAAGEEPNFDPAAPLSLPGPPKNFPSEFFYNVADSDIITTSGCQGTAPGKAFIRTGLEGAFLGEDPVDGEQIIFGRIRVAVTSGLCPNREYQFVNPYGVETFTTNAVGQVTRAGGTEDIGCFPTPPATCDLAAPLQSRVLSGFLRWDPAVAPAAPAGYVGDAITPHRITGGSYVRPGETAPVDYFEIIDTTTGASMGRTNLWTVSGKLSGPLVANPEKVSFGKQDVGTPSSARAVTLTNEGLAPITISAAAVAGPQHAEFAADTATSTPCIGTTLDPGQSCTIDTTFTPADTGARTATLSVTHTGLNSPMPVTLTGIGRTAAPTLNVNPGTLAFDQLKVGRTSTPQTVTVDNVGGGDNLVVSSVGISGPGASSFAVTGGTCSATAPVPPDGSCTVTVAFSPAAAESLTASLDISGTDDLGTPVATKHVALTGTGFVGDPAVGPTDEGTGFPAYYADANGVRLQPCLDGADTACVLPAAGEEAGFDPGQPTVFPTNFPSEMFYSVADADTIATPGCNGTAPGRALARFALEGAFANTDPAPGDQMVFGRIRLSADSGLCPDTLYTITHPYGTTQIRTNAAGGIPRNAGTIDVGCAPAAGAPCDFAEALGSDVLSGFLRWDPAFGAAPAGYLGDGVNAHRITGSPFGTNFVRFSATGRAPLETDMFTVGGKLAGTLSASPSAVAFGNQAQGTTSAAHTVTVRNLSAADTALGTPSVTGPFAIADGGTCGATLAAGATCTVLVQFAPTALGAAAGQLTLPFGTAPDAGTLVVNLAGTGTDGAAPTVALTAPADGATVSRSVTLSATASDNVGVTGVQFRVDGAAVGAEVTAAPYSVAWNTVPLPNGPHTITAVARDAAGNTTTSAARTVTVDNDKTPPTVAVTAPAAGTTVSGTAVSVTADAADNDAVAGVQFKVDGSNLGAELTTGPYAVSWDSTAVTDGPHTITAVARDATGNTTTATGVTVTVSNDVLAPTVSLTAPADGAFVRGTAVAVSADANDNVGVAGVQFTLDGVNLGAEDTLSPYSVSWNTTTATAGTHTLRAIARDRAGHATTSLARTVTVDNTAPVVSAPVRTLTANAQLGTVNVPVTLTWTRSDTGSGLASLALQRSVNGGTFTTVATPAVTATSAVVNLAPGTTSNRFRLVATDRAGNTTTGPAGAAFQVLATQQNGVGVSYNGTWTNQTVASAYGGSLRFAGVAGTRARFAFTGSQVAWVTTVASNRGLATVLVDGRVVATVDTYAATARSRVMAFTRNLTAGTHVLEIRPTGTRNARSTGTRVDVDAFVVTR